MKRKTLSQMLILIGINLIMAPAFSQKKDCKFLSGKGENGKKIQMIASPAKIGNFYVGKREDRFFISYSTKTVFLLAADTHNQTQLRVDSVRFYFDNKETVTMAAVGAGKIQNEVKLKYVFDFVQFEVPLDSAAVSRFLSMKLTDIQVIGEKEAGLHDLIVDKNQEKLIQAFNCWQ